MYQFHIKPIVPTNAPKRIASLYEDIKDVLRVEHVPLVFQYIANYENYFIYIWERMRVNLLSDDFYTSCKEIRKFSEQAIGYMETSPKLSSYMNSLNASESSLISHTVDRLDATNLKMMLLMIGVRESIKGIVQARTVLPSLSEDEAQSIDALFYKKRSAHEGSSGVTKATKMLAPLFGSNTVMVSKYPDYFGHIADEMEKLENTEAYLLARVSLEHLGFAYIEQFDQPLNCSYREFMKLTEGTGYVDEILYLLKDTFPSRFPHLVLTTSVMKKSLKQDNSLTKSNNSVR